MFRRAISSCFRLIESTMKAATTGVPQKIKTKCEKPKRFTEEEVKKILL